MKNNKSIEKDTSEKRGIGRRVFLGSMGSIFAAVAGAKAFAMTASPATEAKVTATAAANPIHIVPKEYAKLGSVSLPNKFSLNTFANLLGEKFHAHDGSLVVEMELVKVEDRTSRGARGIETFSLLFCGGKEHPLDQGTYKFENAGIGSFDLFIVPVKEDDRGRYYEAIFNRLIKS